MQIECYESGDQQKYIVWNDFGSRIIGSAVLKHKHGTTVLDKINVVRSHRGEGVGTKLLSRILRDSEGEELVAYAFESRVDWYRRHGFEPKGKRGLLVKVKKLSNN
ncbi:MAG: GNAT family N-acetyltransferase [Candidatus Hadarchaeota archaeon]|nr:GNAT family N-acetyltransferase [Candidatus Hadarchaeota archaeon]